MLLCELIVAICSFYPACTEHDREYRMVLTQICVLLDVQIVDRVVTEFKQRVTGTGLQLTALVIST